MKIFKTPDERALCEAIGRINYTNPFAPERLTLEKTILQHNYEESGDVWNLHSTLHAAKSRRNIGHLNTIATQKILELQQRIATAKTGIDEAELLIFENSSIYYMFEKYRERQLEELLNGVKSTVYPEFEAEFNHLNLSRTHRYQAPHTFAVFAQITRAFNHIFDFIIGSTPAAGKLRADIWQSIFSYDIYRYNRVLYKCMQNITTLITGESGSGKELVAQAIANARYIPFNAAVRSFAKDYRSCFHPIHLAAMPGTLIESELFGHRKGAFTGALDNRIGHFEQCQSCDSVFLDEIGEIGEDIQVKLLRILQSRKFRRIGESESRDFQGKVIAATNRDLPQAIADGKFRNDLYYRLCADQIITPPLRQLLNGSPVELTNFVRVLACRLLDNEEAEIFTPQAVKWITANLTMQYPWPGNVRELEQCVRNLLIRGHYSPCMLSGHATTANELAGQIRRGELNANSLLQAYTRQIFQQCGSYTATAERLKLDRRTVKRYLDNSADINGTN